MDAAVVSTDAGYTHRIRQGFGHGYDTASILVRVQGASANLIDGLAQEIHQAGNILNKNVRRGHRQNLGMIPSLLRGATWRRLMGQEDLRLLTPLLHDRVNPFGIFELEREKHLPLDGPVG
jgi:hypothetical protein